MAFTFDSTPQGANANSYISVTEADDYFGGRFGAEKWSEFQPAQKEKLLVSATRQIDNSVFGGLRSSQTQSLAWPRKNLFDREGYAISSTLVPRKLKEAVCELAYWIWTEEDRLLSDTDIQQVDALKVGPLDVTVSADKIIFPIKVEQLLKAIGPNVLLNSVGDVKGYSPVSMSR